MQEIQAKGERVCHQRENRLSHKVHGGGSVRVERRTMKSHGCMWERATCALHIYRCTYV